MKKFTLFILLPLFLGLVACEGGAESSNPPAKSETAETETQLMPEAKEETTPEGSELPAGEPLETFPKGRKALSEAKIDFDQDGVEDLVLVIPPAEGDAEELSFLPREFVILRGVNDGNFVLSDSSHQVVFCEGCGGMMGDPWMGMEATDQEIVLTNGGGSRERWANILTINWSGEKDGWFVTKEVNESFDTFGLEEDPNYAGEADSTEWALGEKPLGRFAPTF